MGNRVKKHLLWGQADGTFIIPPVPDNKMLLFRTRAAGVKLAGFLQSTVIETGPRVAAVKLIHTVNDSSNRLRVAAQIAGAQSHPAWRDLSLPTVRACSTVAESEVASRVLAVCKAFDKISADQLNIDSHFIKDLGLDSLDHVEVIMAIEDEFGFEIPDEHAEKLVTPGSIAKYVVDHQNM